MSDYDNEDMLATPDASSAFTTAGRIAGMLDHLEARSVTTIKPPIVLAGEPFVTVRSIRRRLADWGPADLASLEKQLEDASERSDEVGDRDRRWAQADERRANAVARPIEPSDPEWSTYQQTLEEGRRAAAFAASDSARLDRIAEKLDAILDALARR